MKKRIGNVIFWSAVGVLVALGLFLLFALVGYSFSGFVCFGIAALLLCYKGLALLIQKEKRWARVTRLVLSSCLAVALTVVTVTGIFIGAACAGDREVHCEYVVVLGAGLHGTTPSLSLRSRLDAAYDYLAANPETICVVSGGQGPGEDMTEAQCMYNELTGMGIASERIWMEDRSTSTRENLRFSLDVIEQRAGERPAAIHVLSSEYHLLRAKLMAKNEGVAAYGIPARTPYISLFINYFLREIAGVWYQLILGG